MHRSLLVLSLVATLFSLSGCMATVTTPRAVYVEPPPGYVYSYADGSCWADGVYYGWCPWRPGPSYGYYVYDGGVFVYRPHYVWGYRPGYPPPPRWHHRPAHPRYVPPPPPRPHRPHGHPF